MEQVQKVPGRTLNVSVVHPINKRSEVRQYAVGGASPPRPKIIQDRRVDTLTPKLNNLMGGGEGVDEPPLTEAVTPRGALSVVQDFDGRDPCPGRPPGRGQVERDGRAAGLARRLPR